MHVLISVKIYRSNIASKRRQLAEGQIGEKFSVLSLCNILSVFFFNMNLLFSQKNYKSEALSYTTNPGNSEPCWNYHSLFENISPGMTKHKILQSLTQTMTGRQSESVLTSTHSWSSHSVCCYFCVCVCVCKKVLLEQQQKQYNEAKIGKVRKCSSSPQRAQALIGLKVPFRMVCIWQACARVHSHTHTYTHTQSEPWHLYASAFHVLSSLRTLHISTSTLLFIWVARLLITTQPSGQSTGKPAYLWLRKNCTPLQIQIALLCFLVIKWHVHYRKKR